VSSRIVLIGPSDALPGLQERLDPNADVRPFTESEALDALDHIIGVKPALVAMQGEFADSSRGQALINRIKDDATLKNVEVRVMAKNAAQNRVAVKRGRHGRGAASAVAVDEPKALDQRGTRRATRIRIKDGVEVAVDGNLAVLVDLSTVGAQVVSAMVLKPNQRVRVTMGDGKTAVKCAGTIVWAAFEMPKGMATRYRAGIDWGMTPDGPDIDAFAKKNKKH
jgi:archaeosine-15-forming tRNA-guanine transglycosylase